MVVDYAGTPEKLICTTGEDKFFIQRNPVAHELGSARDAVPEFFFAKGKDSDA
jgi:hypothetical protein